MGILTSYADKGSLRPQTRPGGSFGASVVSSKNSVMRLIEAFRSMAPGGWSDDRWEQSRHLTGIVYISSHRKCEQLAQAEFNVYVKDKKNPQGKREITEADPPQGNRQVKPYDLVRLLEHPNKEDSFGEWMYRIGQQMDLTGTALTWMLPNELGTPMELYSIPTAMAIPQPSVNPEYPDGYYRIQPIYPYGPFTSYPTPASAVGAPVDARWVMKVKYPHPFLPYEGYSPLSAMRLHIDEVEMIDKSRFYTMKGQVAPSAVINLDEVEDGMEPLIEAEIQRIKAEWENEFQGAHNHGKIIVGTPGGKIEPWGNTPDKMLYEEGWSQLTSFIMAALGITKPAAGMIDDSSYSTLFATLKQLHLLTLEPMANRIASRITRTIAPFFGDDLILEIRCKRIDDKDQIRQNIQVLSGLGAVTLGECRQALDFPLTGEEWEKERAGQQQQQQGMPGAEGGMPGAPGAEQMPGQEQQPQGDPNIDDVLGWKPMQNGEAQASESPTGQPTQEDMEDWQPMGEEDEDEPNETPGALGLGALGPRKSLNGHYGGRLNGHAKTLAKKKTKSMYEQVREACHAW